MKKNSGIFKNAIILFSAMTITKIIGAVLKIPLGNILGGIGMGYFSTAFSVFQPVYALTVAAFPTVITRLIAQSVAGGNIRNIRKIKRIALRYALLLGFFGTVLILVLTTPFAIYIANSPKSIPAMLIIAPSVFFCCVSAVYKGYYEGLNNMIPTAMSQIIEATFKAILGVFFAYITLTITSSLPYAAAAAVLGISISEFLGTFLLFLYSRIKKDGITDFDIKNSIPPERTTSILKKLAHESLPITVGALVVNISAFIDLLTITNCINISTSNHTSYYLEHFTYEFSNGIAIEEIGNFIYGSYSGIVLSLFGLIPSMTAMLSKSALPAIAAAWESKNLSALTYNLKILLKGTLVVGFPLCIGMAVLSEPILSLLYFSKPAEVYVSASPLMILGIGGISIAITGAVFNILHAVGRSDIQIKLMLLGGVLKLALNLFLIPIPYFNINGAAISTIVCYVFISITGVLSIKKNLKVKFSFDSFFLKSAINSFFCGVGAYFSYYYLFLENGKILRLFFSIGVGGIIYIVAVFISDKKYILHFLNKINIVKSSEIR